MKIAMEAFEEWKNRNAELPTQKSIRERDAAYTAAVERGDMDTAQQMADAAAKEAGYTIVGYHGTKGPTLRYDADGLGEETDYQNKRLPFTVFKPNPASGIYVASNRAVADGFKTGFFGKATGTTYKLYVKFDNPFVANEHVWTSVPYYDVIPTPSEMKKAGYTSNTVATEEIAQYAKVAGYDGVIIEGIKEGFDTQTDDYIAFSPEQVKLADPVVYDDDGNVIPLSERFNVNKSDIRYSRRTAPDAVTIREVLGSMEPTDRMTETEKLLLKRYKENLSALQKVEDSIRKEEETLKTATGQEIIKTKNRLKVLRDQAARATRALAAAERNDGFANLMATSQVMVNQYLNGMTGSLADAQDALETEIKGLSDQLKVLAEDVTEAASGQRAAFARGS